MTRHITAALFTAAALAQPQAAPAQSEQEFYEVFSGRWYVFDSAFRSGDGPCALVLEEKAGDAPAAAASEGCADPLGSVVGWSIRDGRIFLAAADGEVAVLGGNQLRITGEMNASGRTVVVERPQGDGSSAAIAAALRKHRCYYAGFSQDCADKAALAPPAIDPEAGFATVETLANLNVHTQPRRDAPVMGTIAQGTPVRVNQCLTASDGPWCRARFGDESAWLAMTALRQDEWPVLTFEEAEPTPGDADAAAGAEGTAGN